MYCLDRSCLTGILRAKQDQYMTPLPDVVIIHSPKEDDVNSTPAQVVAPAALVPEAPLTALDYLAKNPWDFVPFVKTFLPLLTVTSFFFLSFPQTFMLFISLKI
ncbi:Small ribosomal subunit protein uS3x [Cardamine amara subsp. amara]|uniref:Small ribosomal subunit protein uS3x n=1 Tax=Cardamine amara subsp. amara TaxID=228776 RepID=A0ABD0ZG46_CARAN